MIQNDLLHEFIDKAIVSFCNIFWSCVATAGEHWHCEHCLNTEWVISISHSWLKHLNCWLKAVKNLIHYSWIFNVQLHDHLKKWTLKFKLLYLRYHISYFNKIRRICCVNTRIQSVKVWFKCVLLWLKYSIFLRDCFFLLAHPVGTCIWRKSTYTSAFVVLPFRAFERWWAH